MEVVGVSGSSATSVSTIDMQGLTPYALRWLMETFGMTPGHMDHEFMPDAEADLILNLGDDWANNNSLP